MIAIQHPDATLVQGFHAWRKLGRSVQKGQKGIGIIAPMIGRKKDDEDSKEKSIFGFKVVHVFDVSQTEGDDLPDFAEVSGEPGAYVSAVEQLIRSKGIELEYDLIPGGAEGVSRKGSIVVSPDLPEAKRLMVLVHELAHETMHDSERRKSTSKKVRETEAESVAYVVCRSLGVESLEHSADYIQLYDGDVEMLAKSMDLIQKTAAMILEGIHAMADSDQSEAAA